MNVCLRVSVMLINDIEDPPEKQELDQRTVDILVLTRLYPNGIYTTKDPDLTGR